MALEKQGLGFEQRVLVARRTACKENFFLYRAHRGCYHIGGCAEADPARSVCPRDSRGIGIGLSLEFSD